MAVITHGNYIFGIPEKLHDLPKGWGWKVSAKSWLLAISPSSQEYFVNRDGSACPKMTFPAEGVKYDAGCRLKDGRTYAETREKIQIFTP
jgi:hypothetical protein